VRRAGILLFRRTGVRCYERIFIATKQVSEPVILRMKSFYDSIFLDSSFNGFSILMGKCRGRNFRPGWTWKKGCTQSWLDWRVICCKHVLKERGYGQSHTGINGTAEL
jgi:hypothetical protein